jgi:hypothetical protein
VHVLFKKSVIKEEIDFADKLAAIGLSRIYWGVRKKFL